MNRINLTVTWNKVCTAEWKSLANMILEFTLSQLHPIVAGFHSKRSAIAARRGYVLIKNNYCAVEKNGSAQLQCIAR